VTLLLLHAFPLDGRMWEPLRGALGGGDVAAPTLPGPELDDALERWAARLLADVQGDLVPIGSSMGGYVAFELWRRAPERIRGLVLADTKAGADDAEARAGREASIRVLRDDGFEPFWTGLAPKLFGPAVAPDVVARARSLAAEQPVDVDRRDVARPPRPPRLDADARDDRRSRARARRRGGRRDAAAGVGAHRSRSRLGAPRPHLRSRPPLAARGPEGVRRSRDRIPSRGAPLTGDELAALLAQGSVTLLDVRTPEEFSGRAGYPCDPRQGHIEGAVNVPLEEILEDPRAALDRIDASRPIVAYCHSGQRSEMAAAALRAAGREAENYPGSWHEWSRRPELA
jgi:rhodanese-related sulfurtransferase